MLKNIFKNFTATSSQKSTRFYWSENPQVTRSQFYFGASKIIIVHLV
jgi:hypothetical protein